MKPNYRTLIAIAVLISISALFHLSTDKVADSDSFYHITHAKIYAENGLLFSNFPWVQYSAISRYQADIWYGFHIFLMPFIYFDDPTIGIKFAGIFLTSLVLILFFLIIGKLNVRYPLFWAILLFFSVPDVHWRFLMVRPHILTFIFSILLLYFLTKNNRWAILFSALAVSFFHLALSWIVFLIIGAVLIAQAVAKSDVKFISAAYAVIGLAIGWLARPNPIGAIKLAYIQVVQLMVEKLNSVPIKFGAELKPGSNWTVLAGEIAPMLIIILLGVLFWRSFVKRNFRSATFSHSAECENVAMLIASLMLTTIFGLITIFIARRSIDLFVGFGLVFTALSWSLFRPRLKQLNIAAMLFLAVLAVNTLYFANIYKNQALSATALKKSALWLKDNSNNGDIVFNTHWDNFPSLFLWNQKNYYINGMDPIFEYAFNKSLYWKHYYIDIDGIAIKNNLGYTCPEARSKCPDDKLTEIYKVLKQDFRAKYIVAEPKRNPKLKEYLEFDKRFKKVFENNNEESVFEIL